MKRRETIDELVDTFLWIRRNSKFLDSREAENFDKFFRSKTIKQTTALSNSSKNKRRH